MKCRTRGCLNTEVAQSLVLRNWAYCTECEKLIELDESDFKTLEKEGLLRYEAHQADKQKRKEEQEVETVKKTKRSKSKSRTRKKTSKKTTQKEPSPACSNHPNYGVVRKPRTDCKKCWSAYKAKFPERV